MEVDGDLNNLDFPHFDASSESALRDAFNFLKKYHGVRTLLLTLFFGTLAVVFFFTDSLKIALLPILILLTILSVDYLLILAAAKHIFIQHFAEINNYTYQRNGNSGGLDGALFIQNRPDLPIEDIVGGNFEGRPFRLFSYHYSIGFPLGNPMDSNSRLLYYSVFEIQYGVELPHILLTPKGFVSAYQRGISTLPRSPDIQTINLGGDFDKEFYLYVQKNYEQKATQIFTPDLITETEFGGNKWTSKRGIFSLEFIGSRIYIWRYGLAMTQKDLSLFYKLADDVMKKVEPIFSH